MMAPAVYHMFSNEAERANENICDDLKFKKTHWFPWFLQKYFHAPVRTLKITRTVTL